MRNMTMAVLVAMVMAGGAARAEEVAPKTEQEKAFYALGASVGRSLGVFNLSLAELEMVKKGLTDQVTGKKLAVDIESYGPKLEALAHTRSEAQAEQERKRSETFLAKAATEKGVVKLPSGLLYKEITPGVGQMPKATDTVTVNYRGTLVDGTEFDSSYKRNEPATFQLNKVIPCWTEGVQKMKVGGKSRLICPASIAYGDQGSPPIIPGNATLIFEVELLKVGAEAKEGGK
jgi:FKBP-type peptidyl-prolyl cis-trans isomerase FkpA